MFRRDPRREQVALCRSRGCTCHPTIVWHDGVFGSEHDDDCRMPMVGHLVGRKSAWVPVPRA